MKTWVPSAWDWNLDTMENVTASKNMGWAMNMWQKQRSWSIGMTMLLILYVEKRCSDLKYVNICGLDGVPNTVFLVSTWETTWNCLWKLKITMQEMYGFWFLSFDCEKCLKRGELKTSGSQSLFCRVILVEVDLKNLHQVHIDKKSPSWRNMNGVEGAFSRVCA